MTWENYRRACVGRPSNRRAAVVPVAANRKYRGRRTRSKERGWPGLYTAAQFHTAGQYVGWLSPGGFDNGGHDGGGGPSDVGDT